MSIICIHSLDEKNIYKISKLNKENDILTFDDGLYSIYLYKNLLKYFKEKILFISPSLIYNGKEKQTQNSCFESMYNHFYNNDNSSYMTIDQLKEMEDLGFKIEAHSYYHLSLKYNLFLSDSLHKKIMNNYKLHSYLCIKNDKYKKEDTEKMLEWFDKNMKIIPKKYCFPFNQYTKELIIFLEKYNFNEFYGKNINNRINIEIL
jgi:hypothetical protein